MHSLRQRLLFTAVPPVAASVVVLVFGSVGRSIWLMHLLTLGLAGVLAGAGSLLTRVVTRGTTPALALILLTLVGVTVPFLRDSAGPQRWASIGPLNLYMAPLWLPSFLAACSVYMCKRGNSAWPTFAATVGVSLLLAAQPDASQVLALLIGSTVGFARYRADTKRSIITLIILALVTAWAFTRADSLAPVPYVEGVFALALGHSRLAGVAVITSALVFLAGLYKCSNRGTAWLAAVAAYYAVLFACSVAGLTPAPLVGYGAGPLLGYGLLVAVSRWFEAAEMPNHALTVAAPTASKT